MQGLSLDDAESAAAYNHLEWIVISNVANKATLKTTIAGKLKVIRLNSNKVVWHKPAEEEDVEECTPPPPPLGGNDRLRLSFPSVENTLAIAAENLIGCGASPTSQLCVADLDFQSQLECFFKGGGDFTKWLNIPMRLPGDGGVTLTFKLSESPFSTSLTAKHSLVYPFLKKCGVDMWHHSSWNGTTIRVQFTDCLKLCPQNQIWPFCMSCSKFLFPEEPHRCSTTHKKALGWCDTMGPDEYWIWLLSNKKPVRNRFY